MNARTLRGTVFALVFLGAIGSAGLATADPLFTVTNLGSGYQLQQGSSGYTHGVTAEDGRSYVFEKSPVWYNTDPIKTVYDPGNGLDAFVTDQGRSYGRTVASSSIGSIGYMIYDTRGYPLSVGLTSGPLLGSWYNNTRTSPVSDFNSSGQVVGTINGGFAGFSDKNFKSHTSPASPAIPASTFNNVNTSYDNLNFYIAQDIGVRLYSASRIDDLGQIIAQGSLDGKSQTFLLTPNGQPTPAPEPTILLTFGVATVGVMIRRRMKRQ